MSFDISNNLTAEGIKSIYKKLFDVSVTYNRAFFSDIGILLKLRIYSSVSSYVSSVQEEFSVEDNVIKLTYKFKNLNNQSIVAMRIYNGSELMMEVTDLELKSYNSSGTNVLESVVLTFTLKESTQCIPNESLTRMTESLVNLNDVKITKMYLGTGTPDLSGNSYRLSSKLSSYEFEKISYFDNSMRIIVKGNDSNMSVKDITELGLGYDKLVASDTTDILDDLNSTKLEALVTDTPDSDGYILCTLQHVNFSKINQSDKYIIEYILNIV